MQYFPYPIRLNWIYMLSNLHMGLFYIFPLSKKIFEFQTRFFRLTHRNCHHFFFENPAFLFHSKKPFFFSDTKRTIRGSTCPRYMIVNVHNWRRKSFSFETLDDGIHVSPQGVGGPIHALQQGMKLSMNVWICSDFYTFKIMGCCSPKNL